MVLTAAGVTLPLYPTPMGPLVSKDDPRTEPLAWALNLGATGAIALTDAVAAGQPLGGPEVAIYPLEDDDEQRPTLDARWRELSGGPLGDDPWVISIGFLPERLAVPRTVLVALAGELARLRAQAAKPPGPWFFRAEPQWREPAPGEDEQLRPLERMARRDDPAERPELMRALERHGIFADAWWDERAAYLRGWGLPTLLGYANAARDMHRYLRSEQRRRHIDDARWQPILGAPVSIDWFRHPSAPPGFDAYDWLGACERALRDAPSLEGPSGEVFARLDAGWCRIVWRRDDGLTPAIVETGLD
ncbi:hypothetical protein [Actinoplanes solisilvae]|uniref:hypothetical protein n=1 Tax=Actinoplanes solisilvae TaxID=2486853 RepID=UPI000FDB3BE8|nr:hypothetical protein [Actinoplanes solisilvae]